MALMPVFITSHASSAKGKATRKRLNHRKWSQMTPEERKAKNDKRSKKSKEQREEAEIRSTRVFAADG